MVYPHWSKFGEGEGEGEGEGGGVDVKTAQIKA